MFNSFIIIFYIDIVSIRVGKKKISSINLEVIYICLYHIFIFD